MLSKEDKNIKIGVSILTFIIYEYKSWLSVETAGISKTARVIVLQKCCQTQIVPFLSYLVLVIRVKIIFISIKALYVE